MKKHKKTLIAVCIIMIFALVFTLAVQAASVSAAIESTWKDAAGQIKDVTNKVVFPIIDAVLAILLFVKLATSYFEYKKHGQFEFTAAAILFFGLIFSLTAPLYIWSIVGI